MNTDTISRALEVVRGWRAGHAEVRVFGSVMRMDPGAHDLDIGVDLDHPAWADAGVRIGDQGALALCTELLEIRRTLGEGSDGKAVLDVFVRSGGVLYAPTDDGFWWKEARNQAVWNKIVARGVALREVAWPAT